jgi:hypothetical protein
MTPIVFFVHPEFMRIGCTYSFTAISVAEFGTTFKLSGTT